MTTAAFVRPRIDRSAIALTGVIPEGAQLIVDVLPLKIIDFKKAITEGKDGKHPIMRCTGVFQKADLKNGNGRVYPESILKEAVADMQEAIKSRQVPGEFDHPPDAKIHLDRISHLLTRLWMEGKTVYGEIEVFNDSRCPLGNMLACYLERGLNVGVSSRGVGDMELVMREGEDVYEVQDGFKFVTFDVVAEPSVAGTQLKQMNESLERKISKKQLKEAREKLLAKEIGRYLLD